MARPNNNDNVVVHNKPTQIIPLVSTMRRAWNNSQSKKNMFGFQTDRMLSELTNALITIEDPGEAVFKPAWGAFDRKALDLLEAHQKRELADREFILQGLHLFYDIKDKHNNNYADFDHECAVFDQKVTPGNYDQSSVPLMLARAAA